MRKSQRVVADQDGLGEKRSLSCEIHTHTPAQKSYTTFVLYPFVA